MSIESIRRVTRGLSLIELIVALTIFSIALTGIMTAVATAIRGSADPMIQTQALYIAEGYLDEILARPVTAPGSCPTSPPRDLWQKIECFAAISDAPPTDPVSGTTPAALQEYRVTVKIGDSGCPSLGVTNLTCVEVYVSHSDLVNVRLAAYKADL